MSKHKFWSLTKLLETDADYLVAFGLRSNGKTTAGLIYGIEEHIKSGYVTQMGIVRRWEEDFKGIKGSQMVDGINQGWEDNKGKKHSIEKDTGGLYNQIVYYSQRWYLAKFDKNGKKEYQADEPIFFGFAISSEEHYKSTAYPNLKIIMFDEFITRSYYLPDEFVKFQNLLSTIIRLKNDVKILMFGNTINKYCPYFKEMGLTGVTKQKQGTIDIYTYGETTLKVAVEYCNSAEKAKTSDKYFAFENPKLQMITNGNWEMNIYPHLPTKYDMSEVKYIYFINFNDVLLQCEVIRSKEMKTYFTFIHKKTTPIKSDNKGIIFQTEPDARRNYRRKINKTFDDLGKKLWDFFQRDKVFYQDNEIGEVVRNYLMWCKKEGE